MANLVARRCQVLERAEDRKLVWFLQLLSHRAGGIRAVADELLKRYPDRNATAAMQKFGVKERQVYSANQVREIRAEIPGGDVEVSESDIDAMLGTDRAHEAREEAAKRPASYEAARFNKLCQEAASELPTYLEQLCLDPSTGFESGPWYFPNLIQTLREFQSAWVEAARKEFVLTEIGRRVFAELDYALETRTACLISGRPGAGKSRSAKTWCALHPGEARYVQVPSTNDDIAFYREIAKSLGVSINQNSKAQELRQRIEDTLQAGDLMICLDEAHYLWPNLIDPRTLPMRVNWLMTALINFGVPLALVTTPQFHANQKAVEEKTRWTSEQFMRRIEHCQPIPDVVPEADFFSLTRFFLPEGDCKSIEMIVRYAQVSPKYLSAIEIAVRRARFLAKQDGREKVLRSDVVKAIKNYEIPPDSALAGALQSEPKGRRLRNIVPAPVVEETVAESNRVNGRALITA
jgi:hypothetical protein